MLAAGTGMSLLSASHTCAFYEQLPGPASMTRSRTLFPHNYPGIPLATSACQLSSLLIWLSKSTLNHHWGKTKDIRGWSLGAGAIAQWLRTLAAPPEVPGLIPSIHRVTDSHLKFQLVTGDLTLSSDFCGHQVQTYILGKTLIKW